MQTISQVQEEIALLFSPIIGEFRLKTYFSYYAIFKNNLMIALYQDKQTYLRIATQDLNTFRQTPETYHLSDDKMGIQSKKFYYLPYSILSNRQTFSELVNAIINELEQERQLTNQKRATQIRNLPNMNIKLERMLKKIGIHSIQDFMDAGYLATYIKLIQQGLTATEDLLFKLNGALNHQYIYTFTQKQKIALLTEANQALYEAGLRYRFNTSLYS